MELNIIQIGNSKGIRIPRNILIQYNIKDKVTVDLQKDGLLIKPGKVREGWAESFKKMAENQDDTLILGDIFVDRQDRQDRVLLLMEQEK